MNYDNLRLVTGESSQPGPSSVVYGRDGMGGGLPLGKMWEFRGSESIGKILTFLK